MHLKPYRPTHDISQTYEDGLVVVNRVTDGNLGTGLLPVESLEPVIKLPYEERKLGVQRYYNALQNQIQIQRVIRVPQAQPVKITSQDIAVTEDGQQYRIDLVQAVDVYPPSLDLTLVAYEQKGQKTEEEVDFYG